MYRSPAYLAFIRKHPCMICGNTSTIAHHEPFGQAGMSIKAPDSHAVPLCDWHHRERHDKGFNTFWASTDVKLSIIKYLTEYLNEMENRKNGRA